MSVRRSSTARSVGRRSVGRHYWVALRALAVFTVVLGVGYPLTITLLGQALLPAQANGSLAGARGEVVGSSLIGQSWTDAEGNPLPEWFQGRPSAAGDGYDAGASSGSNQGPESADLVTAIDERRTQVAQFNGVAPEAVPADALTASASGLDPAISPEYARLQAVRVATATGLPEDVVGDLVESKIREGQLGFLSMPTVNVLELNIALDQLETNVN